MALNLKNGFELRVSNRLLLNVSGLFVLGFKFGVLNSEANL